LGHDPAAPKHEYIVEVQSRREENADDDDHDAQKIKNRSFSTDLQRALVLDKLLKGKACFDHQRNRWLIYRDHHWHEDRTQEIWQIYAAIPPNHTCPKQDFIWTAF